MGFLGRASVFYILWPLSAAAYYVNRGADGDVAGEYIAAISRFILLAMMFVWPFFAAMRADLFAGSEAQKKSCLIASIAIVCVFFLSSAARLSYRDVSDELLSFATASSIFAAFFVWYNIAQVFVSRTSGGGLGRVLSYMAIFVILPFTAASFQNDLKRVA